MSSNSHTPSQRITTVNVVISIAALALLAALIHRFIGWQRLVTPWTSLSLGQISAAVSLVMCSYALRAVRLYDYFHHELAGAYRPCLALILQHNMLNNLLPMRTGEISFPLLMARYFSVPPIRSVPVLFWFRMLDIHILLSFAIAAGTAYWINTTITFVVMGLWLCIPYFFYRMRFAVIKRLEPLAGVRRLAKLGLEAMTSLPAERSAFWRSWLWTLVNWLVKIAVFAWLLLQFVSAPINSAWIGVIAGDLTSVLPIHSFAGIGTYEGGVVAAMALYQVPSAAALTAAINLHLFILGVSILGGLIGLGMKGKTKHGSGTVVVD